MDAHGVDVLDGADDYYVIVEVPHDLEFELLPTGYALLDEGAAHRAGIEPVEDGAAEFAGVVGYGATLATQGETRADDEGETYSLGEVLGLGQVTHGAALWHSKPDTSHRVAEELAIFCLTDRLDGGSEQLYAVVVEDGGLVQLDCEVQGRLSAKGRQEGVGAFAADDLGERAGREGFDVGGVGDLGVGHDGRWVRVDEDHAVPFVAQGPAGLGARVVELGGLPDHDGARADDQNARDVVAPRQVP